MLFRSQVPVCMIKTSLESWTEESSFKGQQYGHVTDCGERMKQFSDLPLRKPIVTSKKKKNLLLFQWQRCLGLLHGRSKVCSRHGSFSSSKSNNHHSAIKKAYCHQSKIFPALVMTSPNGLLNSTENTPHTSFLKTTGIKTRVVHILPVLLC